LEKAKRDETAEMDLLIRVKEEMWPPMLASGNFYCNGGRYRPCKNRAATFFNLVLPYLREDPPMVKGVLAIPICRQDDCKAFGEQLFERLLGEADGYPVPKECARCCTLELGGVKFMKCSLCKAVYYCSKDCQRTDWKATHQDDCMIEYTPSTVEEKAGKVEACKIKDNAFCVVLEDKCAHCGNVENPYTCALCKVACYCSKDCQRKDWKAGHKKVCKKG
jgi:hypothetical protein